VDPGSFTGTQLALMRRLARGQIPAPDFARAWLDARRGALDAGERVGDRLDRILTDVFYLLDDFVIDSTLRDPADMSDEALTAEVLNEIRKLDALDQG
jgi:hypothetical protein